MNKKDATAKISELVNAAHQALRDATKIADENEIQFYWNGPAGHYTPESLFDKMDNSEESEDPDEIDDYIHTEWSGWEHSDSTC